MINFLLPLALFLAARTLRKTPGGAKKARRKTAKPIAKPKATSPATYLDRLAILESGKTQPNWKARRPRSKYWGRWQLGPLARNGPRSEPKSDWPARGVSWEKFSKDGPLQTIAAASWALRAYRELKASTLARAAVEQGNLHGERVTWSGLVGMDHLVGRPGVIKWLATGEDSQDANGTKGTTYLRKLGGIDLSAWDSETPRRKINVS